MAFRVCDNKTSTNKFRRILQRAKGALVLHTFALLLSALSAQSGQAQTFTVLYTFKGPPDGSSPNGGLVQDAAGNLYGTTSMGGRFNRGTQGTIFELYTDGSERPIYAFGKDANDGIVPLAGLVRDAQGNLYGTTSSGGAYGFGTVFEMSPSGMTTLHSFAGHTIDGANPAAGLVRDCCGNLYGTTVQGGDGFGTVFRIDKNGNETVLRSFTGGWDGEYPNCLIGVGEGIFYGTTAGAKPHSYGTVFKVDSTGKETVLYRFKGAPDAQFPTGCLAIDSAGNLYGTTSEGGVNGAGTVFKLDTSGNETILLNFDGQNGGDPQGGLIIDAVDNLYGTTEGGGSTGAGVIFQLDSSGNETILHNFDPTVDGGTPSGVLLLDGAGNLYGTATIDGDNGFGHGTVFEVSP
jgi:uncharacterized repeat protein (TIGR03803 family)